MSQEVSTFNWSTDRGKKNVMTATTLGLGVLCLANKPRQWLKSVVGMYEEVHYTDPDVTSTETTTTV